jgi:hypothetical protein
MADTFKKIASVTVGAGGAASIDFTSIPSTYTDLKVVYSLRASNATNTIFFNASFNGVTSNRSRKTLYTDSSGIASYSASDAESSITIGSLVTANTFGNGEIYIPNYASSNFKSASGDSVGENNASSSPLAMHAILWSSTAAINALSLIASTTWAQYSTATLYGISKS